MPHSISRRKFLAAASATAFTLNPRLWAQQPAGDQIAWHDVRDWGVEGKGWDETTKYFDRLPSRAEGKVRGAVWSLSRHSAGMSVRFRTNATSIWADYKVTSSNLSMPHMPATGVSGLDLYAQTEEGEWRWVSVVKPTKQEAKVNVISGLLPGERNYMIYLPLYNGTEHLKIGVPDGTSFTPIEPRKEAPVVFYGTSITHGACASRPGMPHPSILGRRLNVPIINLGFSGNGKMEPEVGDFLTELDPSVYVLDCLPNMNGSEVSARAEKLIRQIHKARPKTPIVLVEDRTYANTPFIPAKQKRHEESRKAFRQAYENVKSLEGISLQYVDGETLLGKDRDDTTDGSHPSDLGFYRQANALEPAIKQALAESK
ncbi:SGNH/GDSL hydrolase family protein [bacterium]|jgi:lysophospholipase L1-like esterase|nr:hypothetical protein [Planctomicrobium sp.]MDB4731271.1 SGNH/GDSL hydrolase family protein [bacterium]